MPCCRRRCRSSTSWSRQRSPPRGLFQRSGGSPGYMRISRRLRAGMPVRALRRVLALEGIRLRSLPGPGSPSCSQHPRGHAPRARPRRRTRSTRPLRRQRTRPRSAPARRCRSLPRIGALAFPSRIPLWVSGRIAFWCLISRGRPVLPHHRHSPFPGGKEGRQCRSYGDRDPGLKTETDPVPAGYGRSYPPGAGEAQKTGEYLFVRLSGYAYPRRHVPPHLRRRRDAD